MNPIPDPAVRPKVLVVDDERFNLNTLHGLLRDDYKIMVATDGEQGIKAAISGRPDLILLDITMPGMDGFQVFAALQAEPLTQGIPVIFITALGDAADETRGLELGAADYIVKPFNPSVVRARVRTQVRLRQQTALLESYSFRDGLTGLANRRAFDERLAVEWSRGARGGHPLSVILIDVDFFKRYNDHHGHLAGDECLRSVGGALQAALHRGGDLAARYGGEEFVVLLPETDLEGAGRLGESLCTTVARLGIAHGDSPVAPHVTVSAGVASIVPLLGQPVAPLLALADQMLYRSKRQGRNQVSWRDPPS